MRLAKIQFFAELVIPKIPHLQNKKARNIFRAKSGDMIFILGQQSLDFAFGLYANVVH